MRAAIYARVSSAAQRDAHSIESQLLVLRRFVAAQGWTLAGEYIDDGRSAKAGKLELRDGFARLVRDAGDRRFDVLVVLDINRLTRTDDMRERAEILGTFQRLGIDIATPSGGRQDLRTMLGELYVTLHALVGAEESRKRVAAITAGKARAIAEGRKPAGPTPYGWTYTRATGQWALDAAAAAITREAIARVTAGETCGAIADDFHARELAAPGRGVWTDKKVYRIVTKRTVIGEWAANKERRLIISIPPIVDYPTWQAALDALAAHNRHTGARTKHVYLMQDLGICGVCSAPMLVRSGSFAVRRGYTNPPAYVCRDRKIRRRGAERCNSPILKCEDVDARVWARVVAALESPNFAAKVEARNRANAADRRDWQADVDRYRAKLDRLVKAEAGIAARYHRGQLSEEAFDLALADTNRERRVIDGQLRAAERAVHAHAAGVPQVDAAAWVTSIQRLARSTSPEARQRVVREIVLPGAIFLDGLVTFDMVVATSPAASVGEASIPSLEIAAGYSRDPGDGQVQVLRFRIVA